MVLCAQLHTACSVLLQTVDGVRYIRAGTSAFASLHDVRVDQSLMKWLMHDCLAGICLLTNQTLQGVRQSFWDGACPQWD